MRDAGTNESLCADVPAMHDRPLYGRRGCFRDLLCVLQVVSNPNICNCPGTCNEKVSVSFVNCSKICPQILREILWMKLDALVSDWVVRIPFRDDVLADGRFALEIDVGFVKPV